MVAAGAAALSVCIITLNEERHLPACLASLPPGCEVIVIDSGSTDFGSPTPLSVTPSCAWPLEP